MMSNLSILLSFYITEIQFSHIKLIMVGLYFILCPLFTYIDTQFWIIILYGIIFPERGYNNTFCFFVLHFQFINVMHAHSLSNYIIQQGLILKTKHDKHKSNPCFPPRPMPLVKATTPQEQILTMFLADSFGI